ncbi:MAG: O-antigen ligase family protein [Flavobacteriales bacterium]
MNKSLAYIFKVAALMVFLVLGFRLALRSPLNSVVYNIEVLFILLLAVFFFYRIATVLIFKKTFTQWEILLCFFLFFPISASWAAYSEFGQPFFHGLVHQRDFYLILSGFYLFYQLRTGRITLPLLEKAFVSLSWFCLIVFLACSQLINPAAYLETDFVGYNELKGGYIFRFTVTFISFGFLYYFIAYFRNKKWTNMVYALLFFSYLVFFRQDRTIILVVAFTAAVFFFMEVFRQNILKYSMLVLLVGGAITLLLVGSKTDYFKKFDTMFAIVQGEQTDEASSNVRLKEMAIAWPLIQKNPILGNGELSNQWHGGYEGRFGYFFPSDIGIVGVIYVAGFLGLLLLNLQFVYGLVILRKVKEKRYDLFFIVCKYFLMCLFLDSLTAGQTIFYAANSVLVITILFAFNRLEKYEGVGTKTAQA